MRILVTCLFLLLGSCNPDVAAYASGVSADQLTAPNSGYLTKNGVVASAVVAVTASQLELRAWGEFHRGPVVPTRLELSVVVVDNGGTATTISTLEKAFPNDNSIWSFDLVGYFVDEEFHWSGWKVFGVRGTPAILDHEWVDYWPVDQGTKIQVHGSFEGGDPMGNVVLFGLFVR